MLLYGRLESTPHPPTPINLHALAPRNLLRADWRAKWSEHTDGATDPTFPFGWAQINSCGPPGSDYQDAASPGGILNPAKPPGNCGTGCAPACDAACLGRFHEWADYGQVINHLSRHFPRPFYVTLARIPTVLAASRWVAWVYTGKYNAVYPPGRASNQIRCFGCIGLGCVGIHRHIR